MTAVPVTSRAGLRKFLRIPWDLYASDPYWVPPLLREERRKLDRKRAPFFEYGDLALFAVHSQDRRMVGRVAAIHNPRWQSHYNDRTGFFGLFECINDRESAAALLQAVRCWLGERGCSHFLGPVTLTTNEEVGVLIEGFDSAPRVLTNYAPPYYKDLFEACGLSKAVDLLSYTGEVRHMFPPKFYRVLARAMSHKNIHVRPFSRRRWDDDVRIIRELYNATFGDVWGFVPLTEAEAGEMGRILRFSDEQLIGIAECDGKPVGCILGVLDINEILRTLHGRLSLTGIFKMLRARRFIRGVRVMVSGILPAYRPTGIEARLIRWVHERMMSAGYERAEFSWLVEGNAPSRRILEAIGFSLAKRHRVYSGMIDPGLRSRNSPKEGQG